MATSMATAPAFAPPHKRERRSPVVQRIYGDIRDMIVDLRLPPGSLISKNQVAQEFGVSPTPVREALLRLEDEGLVDIFPQSKTAVSLIDVQHAREAFFLRRSVEVEIARALAPVFSDTQAAALRALVARQAVERDTGNLDAFTDYDDLFHARIYEFAGYGGLWHLVRAQQANLDRLRRLNLPGEGKVDAILAGHESMLAALASHDPDAAERAVREHLGDSIRASDEIRARYPDYFH